MGFHVILQHDEQGIVYRYVKKWNDLAYLPISSKSIIYQGEPHWVPEMVQNSKVYCNLAEDWHRVAIKAQDVFMEQALENGYILEELNQDQDSFKAYTSIREEYLKIKRGDFLVRNVRNLEVDVKCRKFFYSKEVGRECFEFNIDHLERHLNMYGFTQTPIVIAVYQRHAKGDEPLPESLIMMDILYMKRIISELNLKKHSRRNRRGETYQVYQIPVGRAMKKFDLLDYYKANLTPYNWK